MQHGLDRTKKLAFVPLYRSNAHPPDLIPQNWADQILQRVLFCQSTPTFPDCQGDPTGPDRSLRTFINAASSGRADLDAVVLPMQTIDGQDVPANALEPLLGSQLRAQGFDAAAIVMLGGPGAGTNSGFWSRFVMQEGLGVWAMEFMHSLCGFADLYPFGGNMGLFDEMAGTFGTHPSAYTKVAVGWLDASAIATYSGGTARYQLYSVGLTQPPPTGMVTAVRIGSQVPYLIVEARQKVDQFDSNVPSAGVIVYRVQTTDPLGHAQNNTAPIQLLTTTALSVGQTFTSDAGIKVQVVSAAAGGFSVSIDDPTSAVVPDVIQTSVAVASNLVHAAGLIPKFTGANQTHSWVFSQSPTAGDVVAKGSTVTMVLHTGPLP
jgi:hypothetical protein